jgi:hypothetical protein
MKLYNVTFHFGGGDEIKKFSLPAIAKSAEEAKQNTLQILFVLSGGTQPTGLEANVVVFGVDGSGKSLNKLKAVKKKK